MEDNPHVDASLRSEDSCAQSAQAESSHNALEASKVSPSHTRLGKSNSATQSIETTGVHYRANESSDDDHGTGIWEQSTDLDGRIHLSFQSRPPENINASSDENARKLLLDPNTEADDFSSGKQKQTLVRLFERKLSRPSSFLAAGDYTVLEIANLSRAAETANQRFVDVTQVLRDLGVEVRSAKFNARDGPGCTKDMFYLAPVDEKSPTFRDTLLRRVQHAVGLGEAAPDQPATIQKLKALEQGQQLNDALTCHICLCPISRAATVIPCLHNFDARCINRWQREKPECPLCRGPVQSVRPNRTLQSIVDKLRDAEDPLPTPDPDDEIPEPPASGEEVPRRQADSENLELLAAVVQAYRELEEQERRGNMTPFRTLVTRIFLTVQYFLAFASLAAIICGSIIAANHPTSPSSWTQVLAQLLVVCGVMTLVACFNEFKPWEFFRPPMSGCAIFSRSCVMVMVLVLTSLGIRDLCDYGSFSYLQDPSLSTGDFPSPARGRSIMYMVGASWVFAMANLRGLSVPSCLHRAAVQCCAIGYGSFLRAETADRQVALILIIPNTILVSFELLRALLSIPSSAHRSRTTGTNTTSSTATAPTGLAADPPPPPASTTANAHPPFSTPPSASSSPPTFSSAVAALARLHSSDSDSDVADPARRPSAASQLQPQPHASPASLDPTPLTPTPPDPDPEDLPRPSPRMISSRTITTTNVSTASPPPTTTSSPVNPAVAAILQLDDGEVAISLPAAQSHPSLSAPPSGQSQDEECPRHHGRISHTPRRGHDVDDVAVSSSPSVTPQTSPSPSHRARPGSNPRNIIQSLRATASRLSRT